MMTQVGQAVVQTTHILCFQKDNFWETRNWLFFQLSDSSIKSFEVLIIWLIDFEVFQNFFYFVFHYFSEMSVFENSC